MSISGEPEILKRGKIFHKLIQKEWEEEAAGNPHSERVVRLLTGKRGRVDILVDDIGADQVTIVEVKSTDWDTIKPTNLRRNIRRHIRQIWRYIDSQLELLGLTVYAGIIFPKLPRDPARLKLIELMFEEEGIQVVWHDETIEETRIRNLEKTRDENK